MALLAAFFVVGIPTAAASAECGGTVTGDLELDHDLACDGDGIIVGADGVTIRLNGHTIMGSGVEGSVGILVQDRTDIVIAGPGTLEHFHNGIRVIDSMDVTIRKVTAVENHAPPGDVSAGIAIVGSTDVVVRGNTALGNGNAGIYLEFSDHVLVKDNRAGESHHDGIQLFESDFNVIRKNRVFDNQADNGCGINLRLSHDNLVEENEAEGNRLAGIQLFDSSRNQVRENQLEGNSLPGPLGAFSGGIRAVGTSPTATTGNEFVENEVEEGLNGIFFGSAVGTVGNTYRENEIEENDCGIKGPAAAKDANAWIENEFEDNGQDECLT